MYCIPCHAGNVSLGWGASRLAMPMTPLSIQVLPTQSALYGVRVTTVMACASPLALMVSPAIRKKRGVRASMAAAATKAATSFFVVKSNT